MDNNNSVQINQNEKVRFTPKLFVKMGFGVWRQFDDQYYAGFAAQIAYFFFMSSIPILIMLSQVLGLFDVSMDFIKEWLETHLSTAMGSFLSGLFDASSAAITNVLMVIVALWGASSLEFSLSRLATYTLTGGKYRFDWFRERIKAIPMALLCLLMVASAVIIYVYGEMIALKIIKSEFIAKIIMMLRTPVLGLFFFFIILMNYYIIPRVNVPLKSLLPGSILATVGIMIVTWIYSFYISRASNYNVIYGTFSNIVALLLWFYCISWVICIGMMFNKSWDTYMKKDRLTRENLKKYVVSQYGDKGEEMWNKLYIADEDVYDEKLDTLAVKGSKKWEPGFREEYMEELERSKKEKKVRERLEKELRIEERVQEEMKKDMGDNNE